MVVISFLLKTDKLAKVRAVVGDGVKLAVFSGDFHQTPHVPKIHNTLSSQILHTLPLPLRNPNLPPERPDSSLRRRSSSMEQGTFTLSLSLNLH